MLSAQSRATSAEEVESIPLQGSWEDSPGCWRFSFPQTEAKPEARSPPFGQLLLLKGTLGVAMGEAGRALLSSSWSGTLKKRFLRKVKASSLGNGLGLGIPGGRSHLLERLRLASTEEGQALSLWKVSLPMARRMELDDL